MSQPIPTAGQDWNNLFNLAAIIALIATAIVIGSMVFFAIRYREKKGQPKLVPNFNLDKSRSRDNLVFASISIIILVSLVAASYELTPNARFEPAGVSKSMAIDVTAFQWGFRFVYPDGLSAVDNLTLPGNTTVMFNVTSVDVMHNFYLVEYKVSIEAIPGRYNVFWITTPLATGNKVYVYNIRCKELCGIGHTFMDATMTVVSPNVFDQWLSSQNATSSSEVGG